MFHVAGERPVREQEPVHGGGQPLQPGRHGRDAILDFFLQLS